MIHKVIASELTKKYLIDNLFSDWKSLDNLLNEIGAEVTCTESLKQLNDYQRKCKLDFNLKREDFQNIVDTIPYMFIDKLLMCPCSAIFREQYFSKLNISGSFRHYECTSVAVFETIDDLIAHLKPSYTALNFDENINRFHHIFFLLVNNL